MNDTITRLRDAMNRHDVEGMTALFAPAVWYVVIDDTVVERGWKIGAVPLMLRLVRRGANRGKLKSARFLIFTRFGGHRC